MTSIDTAAIEARLRVLLNELSVEEAVATLHRDEGVGLLPLCAVVESGMGLTRRDANRLVVRAVPRQ